MNKMPEFDPYQVLLRRKQQSNIDNYQQPIEFDSIEVKELQDFCQNHGILGVNFRGANPKSILKMLKSKLGILDTIEPNISKTILHG